MASDETILMYICVQFLIERKFGALHLTFPKLVTPQQRIQTREMARKLSSTWYAKGTVTQSCDKLREVSMLRHLRQIDLSTLLFPYRNNWACILRPAIEMRFPTLAKEKKRGFISLSVDDERVSVIDAVNSIQVKIVTVGNACVTVSTCRAYSSYDASARVVTFPIGNFDCYTKLEEPDLLPSLKVRQGDKQPLSCRFFAAYYKVAITPQGVFVNTIPQRPFFKPRSHVMTTRAISLTIRDTNGYCVTLSPAKKN